MFSLVYSAILGYIIGALPFCFLLALVVAKKDLRNFGSKSVGATNLYRACGIVVAILGFVLDLTKGMLAIFLCDYFIGSDYIFISAFFCVLGHSHSFLIGFKGGKGVSTCGGILLFLDPVLFLITFIITIPLIFITKRTSIASTIIASILPIISIAKGENAEFLWFAIFLAFFVLFRHKGNISRIINLEEKQISFFKNRG